MSSLFGGDEDAQDYLQQALAQYNNVSVPTTSQTEVNNLPQESVQGEVTPQEITAVDQAPNEYNGISLDPSTRQAQIDALQSYQDIANSGGLDANAKLGIQQAEDAANEQSRGAQGAIMQAAQAQGQGGGDFALTQRAIAAQGDSNTAATQGLEEAAEAEANREVALNAMSTIGGNVESSDYNQAAAKAAAGNAINATNAATKNSAITGNVNNNLTAQTTNLQNQQNVNASNATAGQNNAYYNAGLPQQQFNDELAKANGAAGVNTQQASAAQANSNNNAAFTGKLLGTAGTIGGAALGGPVGAAVGGALGNSLAKSNNNASAGVSAAKGGVIPCYSAGGLVHDHGICMKIGGMVPGQPEVAGDSVSNDTVPAMLSPGELVIPRSVPKTGPSMEAFAKAAPVAGTKKKIDLTEFTKGYKGRK